MARTKGSKPPAEDAGRQRGVKTELAKLKTLLGPLSLEEQLAKASHMHALIGFSEEHRVEEAAIHEFVSGKTEEEFDHRWAEIELYRTIHQFSSYFIEGDKVDGVIVRELTTTVQYWCSLACERALGPLLLPTPVYEAKLRLDSGHGSAAELFRAFVRHHKWQYRIEKWDLDSIFGLRQRIYKVVADFLDVKKEKSVDRNPGSEPRGDASNQSLGGGHQPTKGTTRKAGPSSQARAEKRNSDPEDSSAATKRLKPAVSHNTHLSLIPDATNSILHAEDLYDATPPPQSVPSLHRPAQDLASDTQNPHMNSTQNTPDSGVASASDQNWKALKDGLGSESLSFSSGHGIKEPVSKRIDRIYHKLSDAQEQLKQKAKLAENVKKDKWALDTKLLNFWGEVADEFFNRFRCNRDELREDWTAGDLETHATSFRTFGERQATRILRFKDQYQEIAGRTEMKSSAEAEVQKWNTIVERLESQLEETFKDIEEV